MFVQKELTVLKMYDYSQYRLSQLLVVYRNKSIDSMQAIEIKFLQKQILMMKIKEQLPR